MARPCLSCKRPNNERATRCIYCGTAFPDTPPAATEKPPEPGPGGEAAPAKKPAPKAPEVYMVVISPGQELSGPELERFTRQLKLDSYTALQKLKRPAPWVARTYPDSKSSGALTKSFTDMGLDAYVVKQSGIDRISDRVKVLGIKSRSDTETIFLDVRGVEVPLSCDDLFLVVRGRITERSERQEDMEDEVPALQLGKIVMGPDTGEEKGMIREAVERIQIRPRPGLLRMVLKGQPIEIMDFYRKSSPRSVRLIESEFDFSGLGEQMSPSGLINYNLIFNSLAGNNTECPVDTAFYTVGYTIRETPKEDKTREELASMLGDSESAKKMFDNRAHFDDYSSMVYLHHLREKGREKQS